MSALHSLGIGSPQLERPGLAAQQLVIMHRPLQRILAMRGRSIDDVVNCPMVKNEVFGYWKLSREIDRISETVELERQWNGLA